MRILPFFLLFAATSAVAAPVTLHQQGRLFDGTSIPLDGAHDLSLSLYDVNSGGTALWTQTASVDFDNGYFTVELADVDDGLFDGQTLYLGMAVDSGSELPLRLSMNWVPMAVHARSLSGGPVDATEITVAGSTIVDDTGSFVADVDWGQVQNAPTPVDSDTLADLGCTAVGDLAMADGSGGWTCVNENGLAIGASQLSGVLDITQIPVGSGSNQVSAGDHAHSHVHSAADVGALPDTTTAADIGAVPAAGGGGVVITDSTVACDDSAQHGTLRFTGTGELQVCGTVGWVRLATTNNDGSSQDGAGTSCSQLKATFPGLADGVYWIDPNGGPTTDAFEVYCDMTYDNGGWTLVMKLAAGDFCWGSGRWTDGAAYNATDLLDASAPTRDSKSLAFHTLDGVTELHLVTQDGDLIADFAGGATAENLMTTNDVPFATYPVWSQWRDTFGPGREQAPIFMRGGQVVTDPGGCRTNPGVTPSGCGQVCMFCYQAGDGSGCGAATANDVNFGIGGHAAYCGAGNSAYCSTGGDWADPNNRTLVWAR